MGHGKVKSFKTIQKEIKVWADYNFPNTPSYRPLLGCSEELGELCHAHLKAEQGIRGTPEELKAAKLDAVGDLSIYLMDYCNKEGINYHEVVAKVWDEVQQRDWQKNKNTG